MSPMPLEQLLHEIEATHRATPALTDFARWPDDLVAVEVAPAAIPAMALVQALPATSPAVAAVSAAAALAEWRLAYTEAEVGADFLARFGYFELYGPTGHFRTEQARGYISFWGEGLDYDWHDHLAEELYFGLLGSPVMRAEHQPDVVLQPGESRQHGPNERHALTTTDTPFLTYVVWRGDGLDGVPEFTDV